MNLLSVDYQTLTYVTIGLFALGGFIRGWWREGFTTVLLLVLVFLLSQPDTMSDIIGFLNETARTFGIIIGSGGDLSASGIQAAGAQEPLINLDASDRNLYIGLLIIIIIVAYFGSRSTLPTSIEPSAGARLAGGIIGAFNGFIALNLFTEYIVGRFIPGTGVSAQALTPSTVSVQIANLPNETFFTGNSLRLIAIAGIVIVVFLLSRIQDVNLRGIHTKVPVGYKE